MSEFEDKISWFFLEYVHPPKSGYTESGNLTNECTSAAARLLLDEGVFDSPEDMRQQAMKDYGIILPESIFKESD